MLWALLLASITSPPTVTVAPGQVTLFWKTDVPASSEVAWGLLHVDDYSQHSDSTSLAALTTSHSRTLSDLAPGEYFYRVRSQTSSGADVSPEGTFVVPRGAPGQALFDTMVSLNANAVHVAGRTLFAGGQFSQVVRREGQLVLVDAQSGRLSTGGARMVGWADTVTPDTAGGVYVGGTFGALGSTRHRGLAHLLPGGGVDEDFVAPAITDIDGLVVRGATLYAFGFFTSVGGMPRNHTAAFDARTGAQRPLALDVTGGFVAKVLDTGSTVYLFGNFTSVGGIPRRGAAAVDLSTNPPTVLPFNPDANAMVSAAGILNSTVYLAGAFTQVGASPRAGLAAVDAVTGAVVAGWAPTTSVPPSSLAARGNSVYLGGSFTTVNGTARSFAAAVDATTGALLPWSPAPDSLVTSLVLVGTSVFLGGNFSKLGATAKHGLAAVDASSGAVLPFEWEVAGRVRGLVEAGGTLYATLTFGGGLIAPREHFAAFDADTGALLPFTADTDGTVDTFFSNGTTLYVGGDFSRLAGQPRGGAAAFDLATLALLPWDPGCNGGVYAMAQVGSTLYLGGFFTSCQATPRLHAAAVDAVSGAVGPFNPNPNDEVDAIAVSRTGGPVFLGGTFTAPAPYLLATDPTTGAPLPFTVAPNAPVAALSVLGGVLLVGGQFTGLSGHSYVAEFDAMSGAVQQFDAALDGPVATVLAMPSMVLLGGTFINSAGNYHRGAGAFNVGAFGTGSVVASFDVDLNGGALSVAADCVGGRVHFAGGFMDGWPLTQNAIISLDYPVPCFGGRAPSLVDRQVGDPSWRRVNDGRYQVDFADAEGLGHFELAAFSAPNGQGTRSVDWLDAGVLTGLSSTADWSLPDGVFAALPEGLSHFWVRVTDADGNGAELSDVFFVRKDTVPPTAPVLASASLDGGLLSLGWLPSTDATSGLALYQVLEGQAVVGATAALSLATPAVGPGVWTVVAVDDAGNVSAPNGSVQVLDDGGLAFDGGVAPDAGQDRLRQARVACGCDAAAMAPVPLLLLLWARRRRAHVEAARGAEAWLHG